MNNTSTFMNWINETQLRKNIAQTIFVLVALVLLAKTVLLFRQISHVGVAEEIAQTIYVNGHAEEYVAPDTALFTISVNEEGKDVAEATAKAADKIAKAITSLKANGVDEDNIKTSYYNVSDKYENVSAPCPVATMVPGVKYAPITQPCSNVSSNIVGSIVSQSLEVKIRDIATNATAEKKAKIIADLATAGVKVESVTFTIFDINAARAAIREEAIDKAKDDAKKLGKQLGRGLGPITGFSENNVGGGYAPLMSARADAAMVEKASAVQLPAGEQKVSVDVTLTYLLK